MVKHRYPTISQANITYFIISVLTLTGSIMFMPILGVGTNLWVNEFVYILFPALLLARINLWNLEEVYRYKGTSAKNTVISILLGICTWFIAAYITKLIDTLLNINVGTIKTEAFISNTSLNQNLLLIIGMVILAPICEETLFRGFIQKAYEGNSKKYGFVLTALLFGLFHMLNGVKDVIPAFVIGFVLGYIVYQTGSITGSMLAHASNNLCAIVFGGFISTAWFSYASIASLVILILLLWSLKPNDKHNEITYETPSNKKTSVIAVIFLILSVTFMLCIGIMELLMRAGIIG